MTWDDKADGGAGAKEANLTTETATPGQLRPTDAGATGDLVEGDVQRDFEGGVNHGAPINGPEEAQRQLATRGNRSGDGAINRGSIDELLKRKESAEVSREDLEKTKLTTDSLLWSAKLDAVPDEEPPPPAEPAKVANGTFSLTDGTVVSGGTLMDLNGRVDGRELNEKLGEERKKMADAPAGPAAKVPTLADIPVSGRLFGANGPVAEGESGRPEGAKEFQKQLAEEKDNKDSVRFQTAATERNEPARTNPAADPSHAQATDAVRLNLYKAEGNYNLGKYDQAKKEYEKALRVDPYNKAARRGLEQIANAKSSYYRAAYDHTRAELLMEVDKAWELAVPADGKPSQAQSTIEIIREFDARRAGNEDGPADSGLGRNARTTGGSGVLPAASPGQNFPTTPATPQGWASSDEATKGGFVYEAGQKGVVSGGLQHDLSNLAEREMIRRKDSVADADRFVTKARDAYANGDFQTAYAYHEKALGLLPDAPALKDKRESLRESLGRTAVVLAEQAASNGRTDESRNWFNKALDWDPDNQLARKLRVIDPVSEIAAAAEPYSTFSLSISDASFKTAQAALAKGERLDPAGVRVEQFYNAVDYGDPAPSAGEPVAAVVEQSAHPVVPGRNLVRVALRVGATGRSAAQPLQLTLLVDQSGSMAREDRREAMTQALTRLAGLLGPNDRLTVVGFSLTARMLADGLKGDQADKLPTLINQAASEGGTNLEGALLLAKQLAEARKVAGAQNRIVLFTDGAANLGNADPAQLAETVKAMRQEGLAFDVAGIGTSELNDRLLAELARHGNGRFYVVGSAADANDGFARQLAGAFRPAAENVKVQVRFNPQRVGAYKLIGFEEHRLNKEDFRNDAVDAAELAAEEAGVALYQVEPLPGGSGELGEVSVRFRDAASGRMVERSWTIPYDSSAPAFDRAAPSLQLAGLAMLAAEKLRGGPLGEAIDFSRFIDSRAAVKQFYPNNRRVAEVLEMVRALR
jgi:Mg-chelatase subunit ChlD/tetratricopeptide (TPR) repeat protein